MLCATMDSYYHHFCWPDKAVLCAQSNYGPSFSVPTTTVPPAYDSASIQCYGIPSWSIPDEDRSANASNSHSQAEKRRRDRINAQLATLRKLIPKSDKMDKAALLGSVIEHVKDLKRKAMDVNRALTVPTEVDEVTIDYDHSEDEMICSSSKLNNSIIIKASVCCEDRPELFSELNQVLKGLRLTAIKADIASVGGRVKSILVLCSKDGVGESVCLSTLRQSLKLVVSKIGSSSAASNFNVRSKRQRFFLPTHYL